MSDDPRGGGPDDGSDGDPSDWLAAQFDPSGDDADEPRGDSPADDAGAHSPADDAGADSPAAVADSPADAGEASPADASPPPARPVVPVVPVVPRREPSRPPLAVPPAPTDGSAVPRSSGHPMALDLTALRTAMENGDATTSPASPATAASPAPEPPRPADPAPTPDPAPAPDPAPTPDPTQALPVAPAPDGGMPASTEPGPFTAILTTPAAASDISAEPRTFDWNALPSEPAVDVPEAPDSAPSVDGQPAIDAEPTPDAMRDPVGDDPLPVPADQGTSADPVPPSTQLDDVVPPPVETRAFELPVEDSAMPQTEADPPTDDRVHSEVDASSAASEPSDDGPDPTEEARVVDHDVPTPEASGPLPSGVEAVPSPDPALQATDAAAGPAAASADPWWVEEHHEMTRRERRLAEAAGTIPPPAVAPTGSVPPVVPAVPAATPPGAEPADGPDSDPGREPEREPTFTEILGIVREPEPRTDDADPPLPIGSWSLSADADPGEQSVAAGPAAPTGDADLDDEPVDDAVTSVLPMSARSAVDADDEPVLPSGHVDPSRPLPSEAGPGRLPGLSMSTPAPEADDPSAGATGPRRRGDGSAPPRASSGGGIEDWPRERKILLGVAAAVVIVLALVAVFLLSRAAFATSTAADPVDEPTAAVATRTVTAAPVEVAAPEATGPLAAGTHPWSDLQGGECLSALADAWQQEYDVVACDQPHAAQASSVGELTDDAYPGADALQARLATLCSSPEALDVTAAAAYRDVEVVASYPLSDAEWADGDRSYTCFVDRSSGEPLTSDLAPGA